MRRRDFLKTAAVTLAGTTLASATFADTTAPSEPAGNVVLIQVDDLGWRDLGCMGSPVYETPNIDKLAKSGTMYTSAYAAGSLCVPSRACMLTGSQPTRHGIYTGVKNRGDQAGWKVQPQKNNHYLPKAYPTLGGCLTEAGIANSSVGKWHLSVNVQNHGFKESTLGGYLGMPINYNAPFKLGFLPKDAPDGAYLPDYVREAGVDFIERHKDEPFFLNYSTYLPHDEIQNEGEMSKLNAPPAVIEKYEKKIARIKAAGEDLQGHDNPIYAAMIEETDRSVGVIIDKLEQLGLRDDTLVIFISDNGGHGSYTSNAPLRGAKGHLYEGGIRVPMIASMPGRIPAGKISEEPISGIDLYPTICTFLDMKPTDPEKVDGEDLTALLFESKSLGDRNLFWNFPCYGQSDPRNVLRRGDWKLHHRYEDDGYELYHLKNDIGETTDLAQTEPAKLAEMKRELQQTYQRFGVRPSLPANPDFDASKQPNRIPPPATRRNENQHQRSVSTHGRDSVTHAATATRTTHHLATALPCFRQTELHTFLLSFDWLSVIQPRPWS